MTISEKVIREIKDILKKFVEEVIVRVNTDPKVKYDPINYPKEKTFHAALIPAEVTKLSKFERSFSTSLGQKIFEQIGEIIGKYKYYEAKRTYRVEGLVYQSELDFIERMLRELEHKKTSSRTPNWEQELQELNRHASGAPTNVTVISDLYIKTPEKEMFFELKSSKPNADQSKVSKEKMLKIQAIRRGKQVETYFALPDNPYGTKEKYAWEHPKRYFDMNRSDCVLMGKDFWDYIGGKGTWEQLIQTFKEVGENTKQRIYDEFIFEKKEQQQLDEFIKK